MKSKTKLLVSMLGMTSLIFANLGGFFDDFENDDSDCDDQDDGGAIYSFGEAILETLRADREAKKWDYYYGSASAKNKPRDLENSVEYSRINKCSDNYLKKIRRKAFLINRKRIRIGHCSEKLLGQNAYSVSVMLHNQGFTRISRIPIKRIMLESSDKPGSVKKITVGRESSFDNTDMFPYNTHIKIYYCDKKIKLPLSSKQLKRMGKTKACAYLEELGFTNIRVIARSDLFLGVFHSEGEIEKISIDGNYDFKNNKFFSHDATIVVEYHCFKL